jgi:hypothetical protein
VDNISDVIAKTGGSTVGNYAWQIEVQKAGKTISVSEPATFSLEAEIQSTPSTELTGQLWQNGKMVKSVIRDKNKSLNFGTVKDGEYYLKLLNSDRRFITFSIEPEGSVSQRYESQNEFRVLIGTKIKKSLKTGDVFVPIGKDLIIRTCTCCLPDCCCPSYCADPMDCRYRKGETIK